MVAVQERQSISEHLYIYNLLSGSVEFHLLGAGDQKGWIGRVDLYLTVSYSVSSSTPDHTGFLLPPIRLPLV